MDDAGRSAGSLEAGLSGDKERTGGNVSSRSEVGAPSSLRCLTEKGPKGMGALDFVRHGPKTCFFRPAEEAGDVTPGAVDDGWAKIADPVARSSGQGALRRREEEPKTWGF